MSSIPERKCCSGRRYTFKRGQVAVKYGGEYEDDVCRAMFLLDLLRQDIHSSYP